MTTLLFLSIVILSIIYLWWEDKEANDPRCKKCGRPRMPHGFHGEFHECEYCKKLEVKKEE
jgi:hypothetical protein